MFQAALLHARRDIKVYVELLLQAGACPNVMDKYGHAAMMSLIRRGRSDGPMVRDEDVDIAKVKC